jgi:hypothetical protein
LSERGRKDDEDKEELKENKGFLEEGTMLEEEEAEVGADEEEEEADFFDASSPSESSESTALVRKGFC